MAESKNKKTIDYLSDTDFENAKVSVLADRPNYGGQYGVGGLSAKDLKEHFDKTSDMLYRKLKEITDAINDESGEYIPLPINEKNYTIADLEMLLSSGLFSELIRVSTDDEKGRETLDAALLKLKIALSQIDNIENGDAFASLIQKTDPKYVSGFEFKNPFSCPDGRMFGGSGEALLGEYAVVLNGKGAAPGKRAVALNSGLAEGDRSFAAGNFVHTKAVNSRVNGSECFIDEGADASSADGYKNYVSGRASHAGGSNTKATGSYTDSGGIETHADGWAAFVRGYHNEALHEASDAGGWYNKTSRKHQTVRGAYSAPSEDALFVVGNGTSDERRSNAFEVLYDGNATISGVLKMRGNPTDDNDAVKLSQLKYLVDGAPEEYNTLKKLYNVLLDFAKAESKRAAAEVVDSAPETLDTLREVAEVLRENESAVEALNQAIGNKVDKVSGKVLSDNNFSDEDVRALERLTHQELTKLHKFQGQFNGYLKVTVPYGSCIEIFVSKSIGEESDLAIGRAVLWCGDMNHLSHEVLNSVGLTVYADTNLVYGAGCDWYIPFYADAETDYITVYGRYVSPNFEEDIGVVSLHESEVNLSTLTKCEDYYARRDEIGGGGTSAYKEILRVNEGGKGYIAITTNNPSVLEVAIFHSIWGEFEAAHLQLQCRGNSPSHSLLVSTEVSKVYTGHTIYDWQCVWYIPYSINENITVKVKDMLDDNVNEVTAEWVTSLPDEVTEIQSYYASKTDLGNIDRALDNIIEIQNALIGGDA